MTETRSSRLARHSLWLSVVLGVLFGLKLASHVADRLERMQGGLSAAEAQRAAAWLPDHVVRVPLPVAGAPGGDARVPFPEAWTASGARRVHERLAVFVDEQRVPLVVGDADERVPLPRAVLRSRRAGAVLVQCPPSPACGDALLVRQDARFAVAMGALRLARHPAATLALLLVCGLLIALLKARSWPLWATMPLVLGGVAVTAAWFGTGVYATAWAPAILAAEAVLLVGAQALPLSASERDDRRCSRLAVPALVRWMLAAAVALLLVNLEAFSRQTGVVWDARDEAWFFLRFFGSALREGYFGDFLPHVGSGYPVAANIVSGAYNPLYNLLALVFPSSILSANLLYVVLQALTLVVTFLLGRTFKLGDAASCFLALSMVASGFFVGHASHFAYLSAGMGLLACFLGLRRAAEGAYRPAAAMVAVSVWHLGTAGSPEHLIFGGHVLLVVWLYHLVRSSDRRRFALATVGGVVAGAALASPALAHFFHQLARSPRVEGLSVQRVLEGSLRPGSLWNFVQPFQQRLRPAESLDPTMDRFHVLLITGVLLVLGLALWRKVGRTFWIAFALAIVFTLLSLGRYSPIPLREWLAEYFFVYRVGRAPAGQHRGFALFCLALASAVVFDRLWRGASPNMRLAVAAIVAADFVAVMSINSHVRYGVSPANQQGEVPRFKVAYGPGDEGLLNAPRDCSVWANGPAGQAHVIPDRFSWSGYTNLISGRYLMERDVARWAICGPSRLWRYASRSPHPYELQHYSPGSIRFRTTVPAAADAVLLWADVDDGFWALKVNGQPAPFIRMPADLRGIDLSATGAAPGSSVDVEMVYQAPLSGVWRR